jgi:glycosyltransferase involved in cell wall biosynthesis
MVVWLFKDGERIPLKPGARRMRTGMLANALVERGHEVHWFSSTFDHFTKERVAEEDEIRTVLNGVKIHLLHAGKGFTKNFSIDRFRFYRRYGNRVKSYCNDLSQPDCIVCSFPLIDVADFVVQYAKQRKIPVLIDVRDLWPDTIVDGFSKLLRPLARVILHKDFIKTKRAMSEATHLCAMSEGVLAWGLNKAGRPKNSQDRVMPIGYPAISNDHQDSNLDPTVQTILKKLHNNIAFVYVGTFGNTYDLNIVIQAAKYFDQSNFTNISFLLIGQGPQFEKISQSAQRLENVVMSGWVETNDLRALMANCSAGILPWNSIDNAMPNKFFDYASIGLPVISSAEGELENLINKEKIGSTFNKGDINKLIACIKEIIVNDQIQRQYSDNITALFNEKFREETVYTKFSEYLEQVVSEKAASINN